MILTHVSDTEMIPDIFSATVIFFGNRLVVQFREETFHGRKRLFFEFIASIHILVRVHALAGNTRERAFIGVMTTSVQESIDSFLQISFQVRDQRVERRVEKLKRVEKSQLSDLK